MITQVELYILCTPTISLAIFSVKLIHVISEVYILGITKLKVKGKATSLVCNNIIVKNKHHLQTGW